MNPRTKREQNMHILSLNKPQNEPIRNIQSDDGLWSQYAAAVKKVPTNEVIPMVIGGHAVKSAHTLTNINPSTGKPMGTIYQAGADHAQAAVQAALKAKPGWASLSPAARIQKFRDLEAVLLKWRDENCAVTGVECGFTANEIAASWAEMIDFVRFNSFYYSQILGEQLGDGPMETNSYNMRSLKGFCCAVTPFNFPIAIGYNLPLVMALTGNTVVWKPSDDATLTSYILMLALDEAGFPPGVINMITGFGKECLPTVLQHPELACLNFTGSFATARALGNYLYGASYDRNNFPRFVAETGGKDFLVADRDIDIVDTAACIAAGAFGRSGQKCSANSIVFAHADIWPQLKAALVEKTRSLKMTDATQRESDLGPVINARAYEKITAAIAKAKSDPNVTLLCGGDASNANGFYVSPTIFEVNANRHELFTYEIFGPVLAVKTYRTLDEVTDIMNTHNYRLTGSVISRDESFLEHAVPILSEYAGNLYVNRKTTGAVVDQQPFGGDGASGTNFKAGSRSYVMNFLSPGTITRRHTRTTTPSAFEKLEKTGKSKV
jgi:1-pyrroline-5-carboxylate dehydrogenase